MKIYILNAARKARDGTDHQGRRTRQMGALNCWSVSLSLAPRTRKLLCILDWFHIAMQFQNLRSAVGRSR